jgi:uncharacterized C2H2 Zn-finger protein
MAKMRLKLPKVPVSLQMKDGRITIRCPECKDVLYSAQGSPHSYTRVMIKKHIEACKAKKAAETKELAEVQANG